MTQKQVNLTKFFIQFIELVNANLKGAKYKDDVIATIL